MAAAGLHHVRLLLHAAHVMEEEEGIHGCSELRAGKGWVAMTGWDNDAQRLDMPALERAQV